MATTLRAGHVTGATLAVFQFDGGADPVGGRFLKRLRREMLKRAREPLHVDIVKGGQRGLWGLFEATVTASWAYPLEDPQRKQRVDEDARSLQEAMPALIERLSGGNETLVGKAVRSGSVGAAGTQTARAEWRALFATAIGAASRGDD